MVGVKEDVEVFSSAVSVSQSDVARPIHAVDGVSLMISSPTWKIELRVNVNPELMQMKNNPRCLPQCLDYRPHSEQQN